MAADTSQTKESLTSSELIQKDDKRNLAAIVTARDFSRCIPKYLESIIWYCENEFGVNSNSDNCSLASINPQSIGRCMDISDTIIEE